MKTNQILSGDGNGGTELHSKGNLVVLWFANDNISLNITRNEAIQFYYLSITNAFPVRCIKD